MFSFLKRSKFANKRVEFLIQQTVIKDSYKSHIDDSLKTLQPSVDNFLTRASKYFGTPLGPEYKSTDSEYDYMGKLWVVKFSDLHPRAIPAVEQPVEIGDDYWNALQRGDKIPGNDMDEFHQRQFDLVFEGNLKKVFGINFKIPEDTLRYTMKTSVEDVNRSNQYAKAEYRVSRSVEVCNHADFWKIIDRALEW